MGDAASDDALLGQTIDERYRVRRLIGRGGMGAVYEAEHVGIAKRVAIKVVTGELDADALARFRREARTAGAITDPHVVQIFDTGSDGVGRPYIAMEYIDGTDLRTLLANGPLAAPRAVAIARQILDGLSTIHGAGIVHRDIKPSNISLCRVGDEDDFVKVMDFGISKSSGIDQTITKSGHVIGTPQYMSPEQLLGETTGARSDLYAVGLVLYEMLAGEAPFADARSTAELAARHLRDQPPLEALRDAPATVVAAIERALAKEPARRFANARAFVDALAGDARITRDVAPPSELPTRAEPIRARASAPPASAPPGPAAGPSVSPAHPVHGDAPTVLASTPAAGVPRRRWRWLALPIVVVIAIAIVVIARHDASPEVATPVGSADPTAAAREAERGGKYELAIARYIEAHDQRHDPELLFRIGELHERLGHDTEAARYFRRYLDDAPSTTDRAAIEARIARLMPAVPGDAAITPLDALLAAGDGAVRPPPASSAAPDPACHCVVASDTGPDRWLCHNKLAPYCICSQRNSEGLCDHPFEVCPTCPAVRDGIHYAECLPRRDLGAPGSSCRGYSITSLGTKADPIDGTVICDTCRSGKPPTDAQFAYPRRPGERCTGWTSGFVATQLRETGEIRCAAR